MPIRTNGALRRLQAMLIGLGLLTTIAAAVAHEGHDHGAPPPAAVTTNNPRVTAQSDAYELVGILRGDRLGIYLDRFTSNEPVTDARIAVTVGGSEEVQAEAADDDGTYTVTSAKFAGEGPLELIFAVTAPSGDDLLIGTLHLPGKPVATAPAPARGTPLQVLQSTPTVKLGGIEVSTPYMIAGVALALGFLLGLAARRRRKLVPMAGLALVALVVSTAYAFAHEGHDHGADAAKAALPAGDTPRRLPDGTVFVPKPSQRLLNVRTTVTKPEEAQKAVRLIGRVIADPNRSGLVQSINGGRIIAPEKGLPRLGQTVRKGDVLALVEQAVPQADRTTLSERVGEIEQEIAVAETRLKRVRQLSDRGVAPPSQVTDAEIELEGLRRRREIVRQTRIEPEVLRAPIDGTIAAARVVPGQVVASQDVIFQIVDPQGLWVEALVYGEIDPAKITGASATAVDGTSLKLTFQGFSKALQQQATVVQFAVESPPGNLSVGSPVTVFAQNGASVRDIIMPRDAVVRGANGEAVVWRHTDPERFEARPVRTEPFDATRLVVRAGVAEGERIVIRGSELINQIR
ncbi:efflux RND transporter periplasmic adaptor subunit [Microvirga arsenatis]|uniref:Efflux RND transporter periplasmic adaptor subunit n=1 Tax=Microvirga arsenatis TaxID=2692265 RepID=A0ABW9Z2X3_9HYPH|nr:efflux RND transporter periplasmic adaptor subunit [Microvirga arsenatis]NBJ13121.1 efflux RND transporter periplasmic adaptor subunit [Microvirga arsenatis]NBJ26872.1 efflux RND transporter periplasmic adaptor subunit [Microvirga arsenatis]